MPKRKPAIRVRSYGIYNGWNAGSKTLPKVVEITTTIPAQIDIEFGFVVNITGAKNQQLRYCIDHPGILDAAGNRRPPFDGVVYVKTNDWDFYLGDTIWEPVSDKLGDWKLTVELEGNVLPAATTRTFTVKQ